MCSSLFEDHFSLNLGHLQIVVFLLNLLLQFDVLNLQIRLSFDDLLSLFGPLFLNFSLLFFSSNEVIYFQFLHLFKVFLDSLRNGGFGDSNGQYLNAWSPNGQVFAEGFDEFLIELIENVDIYLLKRVFRAKLIDFMMELISNPEFLVVLSVVQNCVIDIFLPELVDDFYLLEIDESTVIGSARDALHDVCLDADFHLDELFVHWDSEMKPWLTQLWLQNSQSLIDSYVSFLDFVEAAQKGNQISRNYCNNDWDNRHILAMIHKNYNQKRYNQINIPQPHQIGRLQSIFFLYQSLNFRTAEVNFYLSLGSEQTFIFGRTSS